VEFAAGGLHVADRTDDGEGGEVAVIGASRRSCWAGDGSAISCGGW